MKIEMKNYKDDSLADSVMFSINVYDADGDIIEKGLYLHFGPVSIRIGSLTDIDTLIKRLNTIKEEIEN